MSRIIMLIPLENNVGLTTISLSLIHFLNRYKKNINLSPSILYISCTNNILDNTKNVIDQYFSNISDSLYGADFSKIIVNSQEYESFIDTFIHLCHIKKALYQFIIIEGMSHNCHIHSHKINYDIAQNINAESIMIGKFIEESSKSFSDKKQEMNFFFSHYQYKNILGIIFNKINDPFFLSNLSFSQKLIVLKTKKYKKNDVFLKNINLINTIYPIIACIPWSKALYEVHVIDICTFLNANIVCVYNLNIYFIENFIFFDKSFLYSYKDFSKFTLVILFLDDIDVFINNFFIKLKENKISILILTMTSYSIEDVREKCKMLILIKTPILLMKADVLSVLYQLQSFNFNIIIKQKKTIVELQKYISSFFNVQNIIKPVISKKYIHLSFSPISFLYHLKKLSKKNNKCIILPESYEIRILKSAAICNKLKIAQCLLLGEPQKIYSIAQKNGIYLSKKIKIINPDLIRDQYISRFLELRKGKGFDEYSAKKQLQDNVILATLMLESNVVDGLVSGAVNTTANTIRPAFQLIKTDPSSMLVSSIFFMLLPNQVLIYGDCAINIDPSAEELAEIAIQSANSAKTFGIEPRIAMLSYSTHRSGFGSQVEKVRRATNIVKTKRPDLLIDGPIQYDAATCKNTSLLKMKYSSILGDATIFIFPELNSGNITYKAVQRSAKLVSIGPILQGLRKPVNDLSRGSSIEDIVYTIAVTSIQSK